jgi:hypothetical protein
MISELFIPPLDKSLYSNDQTITILLDLNSNNAEDELKISKFLLCFIFKHFTLYFVLAISYLTNAAYHPEI